MNFRQLFDTVPHDDTGFAQYAEDSSIGRFLYLDTNEPGTHAVHDGPERIDWLSSELERAADRPVYIFMHHPPMRVHSIPLDMIGLVDQAPFDGVVVIREESVVCHSIDLPMTATSRRQRRTMTTGRRRRRVMTKADHSIEGRRWTT